MPVGQRPSRYSPHGVGEEWHYWPPQECPQNSAGAATSQRVAHQRCYVFFFLNAGWRENLTVARSIRPFCAIVSGGDPP